MTNTKADWLDQAIHLERAGKLDEAREALRKAIARRNAQRAIDARLLLGNLLVHGHEGGEEEAEAVLEKARDLAGKGGAGRGIGGGAFGRSWSEGEGIERRRCDS